MAKTQIIDTSYSLIHSYTSWWRPNKLPIIYTVIFYALNLLFIYVSMYFQIKIVQNYFV